MACQVKMMPANLNVNGKCLGMSICKNKKTDQNYFSLREIAREWQMQKEEAVSKDRKDCNKRKQC